VIFEEWSTGRRNRLWNPQRTQDQVKNSKETAGSEKGQAIRMPRRRDRGRGIHQ